MPSFLLTFSDEGDVVFDFTGHDLNPENIELVAMEFYLIFNGLLNKEIQEVLADDLNGRKILAEWNKLTDESVPIIKPSKFVESNFNKKVIKGDKKA